MTKKLLSNDSLSSSIIVTEASDFDSSSTIATPTTTSFDMHTHRMGSVLEERRDPNFNTWTEIIPERVKNAAKG